MKISYQITENLLGAFMLMLALPASADNRSANEIQEGKNIQVTNKVIKKKGNKVSVQMDLNLDKVMLARCEVAKVDSDVLPLVRHPEEDGTTETLAQ